MNRTILYEKIRLRFKSLINGYVSLPELDENYIIRPALQDNQGILGAAVLTQI